MDYVSTSSVYSSINHKQLELEAFPIPIEHIQTWSAKGVPIDNCNDGIGAEIEKTLRSEDFGRVAVEMIQADGLEVIQGIQIRHVVNIADVARLDDGLQVVDDGVLVIGKPVSISEAELLQQLILLQVD